MTKRVVTIVLMKRGGKDSFDPEVFVGCIRKGVPVIARIACRTLMELRGGFGRHVDASLGPDEDEGGVVEAVLKCSGELLSRRLSGEMCVSVHGAKVWDDAEDSLGLPRCGGLRGICRLGERDVRVVREVALVRGRGGRNRLIGQELLCSEGGDCDGAYYQGHESC